MMMLRRAAVLALLIISVIACAAAQGNPITFNIKSKTAAKPLNPGDRFTVELDARIKEGWHLYGLTQQPGGPAATRIMLSSGQPFKLAGAIKAPAPLTDFDANFGIDTQFYEDSAVFTIPVVVTTTDSALGGRKSLAVSVFFQTCNDRFCLPPKTVKLSTAVEVAANDSKEKPVEKPPAAQVTATPVSQPQEGPTPLPRPMGSVQSQPAAPASEPADQLARAETAVSGRIADANQSLLSFIWLAMSLGALSLLTPCVFPMVPITISYFTTHTGKGRAQAARQALIYAAGIILTFTALGMLLALFVGATGVNRLAANPWLNLLITLIFLSFAMSLLGAYHIQIPSRVLTRLDAATRREGGSRMLGLLLMGLTFTLTSFTCTSPFVGTLLVMAAQGRWQWPLVGMLAFSTVFAAPFFILALAPQLISRLPRSGAWLNSVKVIMGLLEVAAAMKFLSNADLIWQWGIFTREVVLAVWMAVSLLMACYLLGKFKLQHDSTVERVGAIRLTSAVICLAVSFYLLTGLFGHRLGEIESFLPPLGAGSATFSSHPDGGANTGELAWIMNDYQGALAQARLENRLVLIDFTGYTCTNCRWMEANMFPQTEVRRALAKYIRLRLYTDGEGEIYQQQQQLQEQMFKTVALPFYAVVTGAGKPLASFPGLTRSPAEFISFLEEAQRRER